MIGVDIFVHWNGTSADEIAGLVQKMNFADLKLSMITNRGIKVWPEGFEETFCTDHWRCRFKKSDGGVVSKSEIIELLTKASQFDIDVIKTENLYFFDGVQGFSLGQGQ